MIRKLFYRLFDIREGEDKLGRRLRKHGTRGMVRVGSSEGAPISPEHARRLVPPVGVLGEEGKS